MCVYAYSSSSSVLSLIRYILGTGEENFAETNMPGIGGLSVSFLRPVPSLSLSQFSVLDLRSLPLQLQTSTQCIRSAERAASGAGMKWQRVESGRVKHCRRSGCNGAGGRGEPTRHVSTDSSRYTKTPLAEMRKNPILHRCLRDQCF